MTDNKKPTREEAEAAVRTMLGQATILIERAW